MHCQPAGRGSQVLDYLGRYVFRIALSNSRLEQIQDGQVTFRYRDNRTQALRRVTLSGVEFLHSGGPRELDRKQGSLSEALPGSHYAASRWGSGAQ